MSTHAQSPLISIPKKSTDDVDWTGPIRSLIAQSYGESPDNYATECVNLQRCRQDAVKGAGSELTARDLLYKYFGQLELLELRFPEIRVNFPWRDAFTSKLTTQTSIAFEKASVIFQIAATHSSIAAQQSRSDPEGLKRAFYYLRSCSGMLQYINDNFLHAPSTDLSREVIKFLVGVIQAQATEVFLEKCKGEKKGDALVAKIAAQVTYLYSTVTEEVKEFMGKGIFERNWVLLLQIKASHFASVTQYHRGLADDAAGKHGDALVRFQLAEKAARDAWKLSDNSSLNVASMSPNLPADAGMCITDLTKAQLAICTERHAEAKRDNDMIYNAVLPQPETLPVVEKAGGNLVAAIPIQDVYGTPEVQKVIGPDLFLRLVPLSVHESASVYSEEKAKLIRGEVEKADTADVEARSALDASGVKDGLSRYKAIADGGVEGEEEVPLDVRRWKQDISVMEEREGVAALIERLDALKVAVKKTLNDTARELDTESRECETMRVKYEHLWTQEPSGSHTKTWRQDLKSHLSTMEAAAASDQQVYTLWNNVRNDIALLLSPQVEDVFRASTEGGAGQENLLDLDVTSDTGEQERTRIGQYVSEIENRVVKMDKIAKERHDVLKDLKDKLQNDDVSHLLLLNRRNSGVEPTLFAAELEKFRPYQQRLAQSVHHQQTTLQEISQLWKGLKDLAGRGPGAKKWEERERRKKDTVRRFSHARDGYMEVRDGLAKGLAFYTELTDLSNSLSRSAKAFVSARNSERNSLVGQLDVQQRLGGSNVPSVVPSLPAKPPALPTSPGASSLQSSFSALNLGAGRGPPPTPPQSSNQWSTPPPNPPPTTYATPGQYSFSPPPLPPAQYATPTPASFLPPPPPRPSQPTYSAMSPPPSAPQDPYANLDMFGSAFPSAPPAPPPSHTPQSYAPPPQQQSYAPPPPQQSYAPPPQQQYYQQQPSQPSYGQGFPPPPPPTQSPYGAPPPSHYGGMPPPPPQGQYSQPQNAYPGPPPPRPPSHLQSPYQPGYGR